MKRWLCFAILFAAALSASAEELRREQRIARDIAPKETHRYELQVAAGEYVRIAVEQQRTDITIAVTSPAGVALGIANTPQASGGAELFSWLASESGTYRVDVQSLPANLEPGRYEIRVDVARVGTESDKTRAAAEDAFREADRLRGEAGAANLKASLAKYKEALPLFKSISDDAMTGDTLHNIGYVHDLLSEYPKAIEFYEQARTLRHAIGDARGEAESLTNLGIVNRLTGNPQKALELYEQALALRRQVGDRRGEASTLHSLGTLSWSRGDYKAAETHYGQALAIRREIGDRVGEAESLNGLGVTARVQGRTDEALNYYDQALRLKRAVGDRRGTAMALQNVGVAYSTLGDFPKALAAYDEAIAISHADGDRLYESTSLTSAAIAWRFLREWDKSLDAFKRALALKQAIGDKRGQAEALSNIGLLYEIQREPKTALEFFTQALPLNREVGDRRGEAFTLQHIGVVAAALGDSEKALAHVDQALAIQREIGDDNGISEALLDTAIIERDLDHPDKARAVIEQALAMIESSRSRLGPINLRASYLALKDDHHKLYVDVLMRLHERDPRAGHDAEALVAHERGRARTLRELIAESRAGIRKGIEPALAKRQQEVTTQLSAKERDRLRIAAGKHTDAQLIAAEREVDALLTEAQKIEAEIRTSSPRFAELTQPQTLSLAALQQLLDDDTVLLEYSLGKQRSYVWAVTRHSLQSKALAAGPKIDVVARRLNELLSGPRRREFDAPLRRAANELADMIIAPVANRLRAKRLLIVADGTLQFIPFAALPLSSSNRQPLIVEHEIVSLPSASIIAELRAGSPRDRKRGVAIFADPVLRADDPRVKTQIAAAVASGDRSRGDIAVTDLERLPHTRAESNAIRAIATGRPTLEVLDFDASRDAALDPRLGEYGIIHFATHAVVDNQRPELSGIVLSQVGRDGTPRDGLLRLHDVYNLELNADLVVLSACRTALGRQMKGEGLIGLSRGFMYAGVPRIVASLWDVRDAATAEFMKRFYRGLLREKRTPAAALRAAQVSFWKEGRPPSYWAPFVLQGEWR